MGEGGRVRELPPATLRGGAGPVVATRPRGGSFEPIHSPPIRRAELLQRPPVRGVSWSSSPASAGNA
eukprot:11169586-Alexandrium_andersonii.AAC.1